MCAVWFTLEFVLRFMCSPQKLLFLITPMNLIDIAAIAPYYVTQLMNQFLADAPLATIHNRNTIRHVMQILRVLRLFRVLKIVRHLTGLQALGYTLSSSYRELGLLALFLFLGAISFAGLIYFAENTDNREMFSSIPAAFWYFTIVSSVFKFIIVLYAFTINI